MNNTHRTYIKPETEIIDIIRENRCILLMLEHFNIDFSVGNKTAQHLCSENGISLEAFLAIANLYNSYYPDHNQPLPKESLLSIVSFLKNSHYYYRKDKYPELIGYIKQLKESTEDTKDIELVEIFFTNYYNEVNEHLSYEDEVAFPFFLDLLNDTPQVSNNKFAVKDYTDHHSDIETKLEDLKSLFLNAIHLGTNLRIKRNFYNALSELEFDLKLHSIIEEMLLVPNIERIEIERNA